MSGLTFAICLLLVFRGISSVGLEEGDQCIDSDGSKGICKLITDCPAALESLQHGVLPQNLCGFVGTQSIVCCKGSSATPAPTPEPPPPTPTPESPPPTTTSESPLPTTNKPTPQPSTATPGIATKRVPGDISKQKCKEYAKYARDDSNVPTLSLISRMSGILECDFDKLELIVGGKLASRHEFPHMALIGYATNEGTEWACGGSLISENYILTAAHCLESNLGPAKYVKLGVTNKTDTANLQERDVSYSITHPEYRQSLKYHDIGLLRLARNCDLNPYVRPACLQTEKRIPYEKAIASGWGKINDSGPESDDLLKIVLQFFDLPKCNSTYKKDISDADSYIKDGIINDYMICAGSKNKGEDTCKGDSGGPLQVYHENTPEIKCMYNIVGITSFGKHCGLMKNTPGVYTRVSQYLKWIEDHVWP